METESRLSAQVKKAVSSLRNHEKISSASKSTGKAKTLGKTKLLLEDGEEDKSTEQTVSLLVGFTQMSEKASVNPHKLILPHPFRQADNEDMSVCIITKDPQRLYKDTINPLNLKAVKKIIGVSKLRNKFKPFEAKRQLCNSFDLFLADSSVLPLLPKLLGKKFFLKKKQPVSVKLTTPAAENMKEELVSAIEGTYFFQSGGSNTSIKIGTLIQNDQEIAANVEAALKQLAKKLPQGFNNVRTIHLKSSSSIALPVYVRDSRTEDTAN